MVHCFINIALCKAISPYIDPPRAKHLARGIYFSPSISLPRSFPAQLDHHPPSIHSVKIHPTPLNKIASNLIVFQEIHPAISKSMIFSHRFPPQHPNRYFSIDPAKKINRAGDRPSNKSWHTRSFFRLSVAAIDMGSDQ
jgi:hypothetical protein